jgi:hypothetical protein
MMKTRLRMVFFVNEEPPHFKTDTMGSLVYARALAATGEKVRAMLALETLGAYSDRPGSQKYPPPLSFLLPNAANFVAVVGTLGVRPFVAGGHVSLSRKRSFAGYRWCRARRHSWYHLVRSLVVRKVWHLGRHDHRYSSIWL